MTQVVSYDASLYTQRKGVCIGSRIAPLAAEVYLEFLDMILHSFCTSHSILKIYRYVDDILILTVQSYSSRLSFLIIELFNFWIYFSSLVRKVFVLDIKWGNPNQFNFAIY